MQRILQNAQSTVSVTFTVDGTPTDPAGAATVTITHDDGTPLATGAGTAHTGVGTFAYTLTPTQTATLERLTFDWTSSLGTRRTFVEVAGGFLFRLDELRAQEGKLADEARYPASMLADTRTLVEDAIEHAAGVAFVPRGRTEEVDSDGGEWLTVSQPMIRRVRAAEDVLSGAALNISSAVGMAPSRIYNPNLWPLGYRRNRVRISYEHGWSEPPPRVSRAALILARVWLLRGPIDDRATQVSTAAGGVVNLATPGVFGSTFGVPEVDAVVREYAYPKPGIVSLSMAN